MTEIKQVMKENVAFVSHHKFVLIYIMKTDHLLEMIFNEEKQTEKL